MLEPDWIRRNHETFDVFHVHFGFDAQHDDSLRALVRVLREYGKPLVYTVHDLRNPHHLDPAPHQGQLDVLVPAAHELVTLTRGAAEVLKSRWGRTTDVLPHPHVVELSELERPRKMRDEFVVAVHLKSLRPNMDCLPVLEVAAGVVAELPATALRVDVHTDIVDRASPRYHPELVDWLGEAHRKRALYLRVHDYFSDEQLWIYLRDEIDVSVLPYRFGTHSGWLEACHDLGTTVIAPSCGFYAQQRPCYEYGHSESGLDAESLAAAVRMAHDERPSWRTTVADRHTERRRVSAAHRELYERVLRSAER